MIAIDGSQGEGGGQIVRSSLALAILTGQDVSITSIRAGRDKPGLRPQHLTAVRAAARICDAQVEGAEVGATSLIFTPGPVRPGEYTFDIGTAGSTSLVLQTILLPLLAAGGSSLVRLRGGTHNPFAPPFEFLERCYLPLLNRMGGRVSAQMLRRGFYPAGGGEVVVHIEPASAWTGIELMERGPLEHRRIQAVVARLPEHIAQRECDTILNKSGWPRKEASIVQLDDTLSPGNTIAIEFQCQHVTELFMAIGRRGVPAERVASRVWKEAGAYWESQVPVGPYLADQLLLPMSWLASLGHGGSFRTMPLSLHSETHMQIVSRFLNVEMAATPEASGNVCIRCDPR